MIKVLIVEDTGIIKKELSKTVQKESNARVIGCIPNGEEVIKTCDENPPDLVIMYIGIQPDIEYSVIKKIKKINKSIKIMVIANEVDRQNIFFALQNGADGYVISDETIKEILISVRDSYSKIKCIHKSCFVNRKKSVYNYEVYSKILFTLREQEVLYLISEGLSNHEISALLKISAGRVKNIVADLLTKCMVKNRTQLAVLAVKMNMASINE